jgi:hypothetical protein
MSYSAPGLPAGRINLLRGGSIAGQIDYRQNALADSSSLKVYDSQNRLLASASRQWVDCHPGRCLSIQFNTQLDNSPGFPAAYEVRTDRSSEVTYWRYGRIAQPLFWQRDLRGSVQWMIRAIASGPGLMIRSGDPCEQLYLGLAASPAIAPYLAGVKIMMAGGRIHVVGSVPSTAVYGLMASRLSELGFQDAILDLSIFTGLQYPSGGYPANLYSDSLPYVPSV